MFELDVCYKIIFQSLFEEDVLERIIEKVNQYTGLSLAMILVSGKIIACAGKEFEHFQLKKDNYLRPIDFERDYKKRADLDGIVYQYGEKQFVASVEIKKKGRIMGYNLIAFSDPEDSLRYVKLNEMIRQAAEIYFKEATIFVCDNIPMRRQVCARAIFEGNYETVKKQRKDFAPGYLLAVFLCEQDEEERNCIFQKIHDIWREILILFEDNNFYVLFYGLDETKKERIIKKVREIKLNAYISDLFFELFLCRTKRNLLKQIAGVVQKNDQCGIILENEWFVKSMYAQALSVIKDAGLNDYLIEKLEKEDNVRKTQLYETLKTYWLCECNVTNTAEKLHIHRNTLIYRLKQIRQLLNIDINDYKVAREMLAYMMIYDIGN